MKVIFTSETKEDFRKHYDYVRRLKKSNSCKYSHIKPEESKKEKTKTVI